ncbi:hypothetical protein Vafri_11764, partial [Volvox africanus]
GVASGSPAAGSSSTLATAGGPAATAGSGVASTGATSTTMSPECDVRDPRTKRTASMSCMEAGINSRASVAHGSTASASVSPPVSALGRYVSAPSHWPRNSVGRFLTTSMPHDGDATRGSAGSPTSVGGGDPRVGVDLPSDVVHSGPRQEDSMSSFLLLPGSSAGKILGTCSSVAQPCGSSANTLRLEPWYRPAVQTDPPGQRGFGSSTLPQSSAHGSVSVSLSNPGNASAAMSTAATTAMAATSTGAVGTATGTVGAAVAGADSFSSKHSSQPQPQPHLNRNPQQTNSAANNVNNLPSNQNHQMLYGTGTWPSSTQAQLHPQLLAHHHHPLQPQLQLQRSPYQHQLQVPPQPRLQGPIERQFSAGSRLMRTLSGRQMYTGVGMGGTAAGSPAQYGEGEYCSGIGDRRLRPYAADVPGAAAAAADSRAAAAAAAATNLAAGDAQGIPSVDAGVMAAVALTNIRQRSGNCAVKFAITDSRMGAEEASNWVSGAAALGVNGVHPQRREVAGAAAVTLAARGSGYADRDGKDGKEELQAASGSSDGAPRRQRMADGVIGMLRQALASQDRAGGPRRNSGDECWHEIWATRATDPVTGKPVLVLVQHDVTAKVIAERHLALVMETEHRLLEQLFPRHILAYITEDFVAKVAAAAAGSTAAYATVDAQWRPTVRDCKALATWHPQVTLLFADIKGFTPMCKEVEPPAVMAMLNDLYCRYDQMLDEYGVFKVSIHKVLLV